jgi:hypothetical protein
VYGQPYGIGLGRLGLKWWKKWDEQTHNLRGCNGDELLVEWNGQTLGWQIIQAKGNIAPCFGVGSGCRCMGQIEKSVYDKGGIRGKFYNFSSRKRVVWNDHYWVG